MKFAYADPPYLGCGKKHYGDATYDSLESHQELIESLSEYDGWAYSLTSSSLQRILPFCPTDVRVAAWVKPFAVYKPNVNPGYTWEPVIFRGSRKYTRKDKTIRDFLSENITLKKGLVGAKPKAFCLWIFNLLNILPGDEFTDVFPGTGIVTECWNELNK